MAVLSTIDVGSNTVRLLAAEVRRGRVVKEVLNLRRITRLGEGLRAGGALNPEARERTLAVLKDYAEKLFDAGVEGVSVIGTEALRIASDAASFVEEVRDEAGLELKIIPGEEEARLMLLGVKAGMGRLAGSGNKLLVDIGGGSTEFVSTKDWRRHKALSLPLGAVSLYERFLISNDPPNVKDMVRLEEHCVSSLKALEGFRPKGGWSLLIGTAGTITTLAAVSMTMEEYEPEKVTGHVMGRVAVETLLWRFAGLTKENRKLLAGLEPGREDIILSGTALLVAIMGVAGLDSITVCDYGLREGSLLDLYNIGGFK